MKKGSPGRLADDAFRTGIVAAAALGLVAVAGLYAAGTPATTLAYVVLVAFPFYLVFAAAATNVWLGYGGGSLALRPVESAFVSGDDGGVVDRSDGIGAAIDGPRVHAVAVAVAAAAAVALWQVGRPADAVLVGLFGFLAAAFALQAALWPRLVALFGGAADESGSWVLGVVAPESAAAVAVATLISVLFLVGVGLVGIAV